MPTPENSKAVKTVLILGGSGFVGQQLGAKLAARGYSVRITSRNPQQLAGQLACPAELFAWEGPGSALPPAALAGCDAVVNLVGENIAAKPWTRRRRQALLDSRTGAVRALAAALEAMPGRKPEVVVQASAIGYYGDRGDERLTEASKSGRGFLAETCMAWEEDQSRQTLAAAGVRHVVLRIGLVLGMTGGAVPELIKVYAKGLGAKLGDGKQWVSWIHIDDLTEMLAAAITATHWQGTFNATAPEPCRFADFNRAFGEHGGYPWRKTVPALAVKAAMGGRAALVLDSARVVPAAAEATGFRFAYASLDGALDHLFGAPRASRLRRFTSKQWLPFPPERLWGFFTAATNLERITPPFLGFKVVKTSSPAITDGSRIRYRLRLHGMPLHWDTLISRWQPNQTFVDEQVRGPYAVWHHTHRFEPLAGGTLMTDEVLYKLPVAAVSELVVGPWVERDVEAIFAFRRQKLATLQAQDLSQ